MSFLCFMKDKGSGNSQKFYCIETLSVKSKQEQTNEDKLLSWKAMKKPNKWLELAYMFH